MTKPTPKQIAFLEAIGIKIPPSKNQAQRLISFVKIGFPGSATTESRRIALIKAYERKFLDKAVYDDWCKRRGKVIAISARFPDEKEVDSLTKGMLIVVKFFPPGREVTISVTPASLTIVE